MYDGMAYFGDKTLVECAEAKKRHQECSSLAVCVVQGSTSCDFVLASFPSDFIVVGSSHEEGERLLRNGTCNVLAADKSELVRIALSEEDNDRHFTIGKNLMTKEPRAVVTRSNDHEFSDITNWVLQALFYGEEQGLAKNLLLCQNDVNNLTSHQPSNLKFLHAVYCVGSYDEIFRNSNLGNRGMNQVNNASSGMLYATPFGELETEHRALGASLSDFTGTVGSLHCGVIASHDFDGKMETKELVGMSVDYCQTLAAALFGGDYNLANMTFFSESDAFFALDNGTIDVLAGGRVRKKSDFASPPLRGFQFSTPYYYGNETAR